MRLASLLRLKRISMKAQALKLFRLRTMISEDLLSKGFILQQLAQMHSTSAMHSLDDG